MSLLPCPICSTVIREGVHRKPMDVRPFWLFASMTSRAKGTDHFCWSGCKHALAVGPELPTDVKQTTEARWNVRARELVAEATAKMTPEVAEEFTRVLGITTTDDGSV